MEERALGGTLWYVGVGIVSEMPPRPLLGRGGERPQEGQWPPSATWKQRRSCRAPRTGMEGGRRLSGGALGGGLGWGEGGRAEGREKSTRGLPALAEPHLCSP